MKLSIITINYNNVDGLRKTMESVFAQTSQEFEYIVVDGASTDGSVDVIHEFDSLNAQRSMLSTFTWVSEKDSGIYNAMNKGIEIAMGKRNVNEFNRSELVEDKNKGVRAAKGEYVLMLNSGDYFVDEHVVERILPELDGTDIVQGNAIIEQNGELRIHRGYGHSDLSFIEVQHGDFPHQATFARKSVFEQYGYFDESYRLIADTVFFFTALGLGNATFKYVDVHIAYFTPGGASDTQKDLQRKEHERMETELLSIRLRHLCRVEEYKIVLWEKLHNSRFLWYGTMFLVHVYDLFHKRQKRALSADKMDKFIPEAK